MYRHILYCFSIVWLGLKRFGKNQIQEFGCLKCVDRMQGNEKEMQANKPIENLQAMLILTINLNPNPLPQLNLVINKYKCDIGNYVGKENLETSISYLLVHILSMP